MVPIVALSSRSDEQGEVRALDLVADDYVTKPFGMEELAARMRTGSETFSAARSAADLRRGALRLERIGTSRSEPTVADASASAATVFTIHQISPVRLFSMDGSGRGRALLLRRVRCQVRS
jgi:DNA-binding response OmpR family regulator